MSTEAPARYVTQEEVDYEVLNHLRLLQPVLERIGNTSAAQVSSGYVEWDGGPGHAEYLTNMGWSTADACHLLALQSAQRLHEINLDTTGDVSTSLLSDVQHFMAVAAWALHGMAAADGDGADPTKMRDCGIGAPSVAMGLSDMLQGLLKRAEAGKVEEVAHV